MHCNSRQPDAAQSLSALISPWDERDIWVSDSSSTYDRTSGIHLLAGLAAGAESRGPETEKKERKKLDSKA